MQLPIIYEPLTGRLTGAYWEELVSYYPGPNDPIRQIEKASIRLFMESARGYLHGRVLDFGCGKQPYKDLVTGEYVGIDQGDFFPDGQFDAVMVNQLNQYLTDPAGTYSLIRSSLKDGGYLVTTFTTNWDVVEEVDMMRHTANCMERTLRAAGFEVVLTMLRASIRINSRFSFPLGYGTIARRPDGK